MTSEQRSKKKPGPKLLSEHPRWSVPIRLSTRDKAEIERHATLTHRTVGQWVEEACRRYLAECGVPSQEEETP